MNKFYWIPAVGEPKLIESEDSVNKVWHDLMNDPDHNLCFEMVHNIISPEIVFLVDDCGKMKEHKVNHFGSSFYPGTNYGDYIAGDLLVARIVDVPCFEDDLPFFEDIEIPFFEKDIGSLTLPDIDLIYFLLEVHNG